MKDRFRQIIENADEGFSSTIGTVKSKDIVSLTNTELDSASDKCVDFTTDLMEKLVEMFIEDQCMCWSYKHKRWMDLCNQESFTTRELIAKFLSDYTHNSNTQKR